MSPSSAQPSSTRPPPPAGSTVELLVNSSPVAANQQPAPNRREPSRHEHDGGAPLTASPLRLATATVEPPSGLSYASPTLETTQQDSIAEATTTSSESSDPESATTSSPTGSSSSSSFHSHDKSLSNNAEDFGKISESLQTNPLDLIDLQNSRSSFELPSQLESLAMLLPKQQQQLNVHTKDSQIGAHQKRVGLASNQKNVAKMRSKRAVALAEE